MNKIQDIKNCFKKIPVYNFLDSNENIQSLLDDKLLFYTKLIYNECDFSTASSNEFIYIYISQKIEIEESFKKTNLFVYGVQMLPVAKAKSLVKNGICVERWSIKIIKAKGEAF